MFDKAEKLDTSSAEFNALPAEVKHELLTEIKDSQRRRYRRKNEAEVKLPQVRSRLAYSRPSRLYSCAFKTFRRFMKRWFCPETLLDVFAVHF